MSVKNEHEEYVWMKEEWQKCLDFTTSEKVVHGKGETYLPRLSEDEDDEYAMYVRRAPCMMYARRAVKAMVGMVSRKPIYVKEAEKLKPLLEDIDDYGKDFEAYGNGVLADFLTTGRGCTLVDVPNTGEELTKLQAEALGIRPRFIYYEEMDLINWRTEKRGNKTVLVLVVLREKFSDIVDEFTWKQVWRYRVLDLTTGTQGKNVYRQRVFAEDESVVAEYFPRQNGQFLDYIPVVIHGGVNVQIPPLNGVVDLNKHHYMLGADEVHGLRSVALPTPYFFGEDPEDKGFPKYSGPGRVIGSEKTDAKTGFREFTGAGMASVANKLQKFEDSIIMLSVQVINDTPNQSATTSNIDYANATATLVGIVQMLSKELTKCLQIAANWYSINVITEALMNIDFISNGVSPQKLVALLQAYMQGSISYDTFYKNLAVGEVTDPLKESTEEMDEIKAGMENLRIAMSASNPPDKEEEENDGNNGSGTEGEN